LKTLPPVWENEEEMALARRVLEPHLDDTMEHGDDRQKSTLLHVLAKIDPTLAREELERAGLKDGFETDIVRFEDAKKAAGDDPDEAQAVIAALSDPYTRAYAYAEASGVLPAAEKTRKVEWLNEALVQLRSVNEPAQRIALTSLVAEKLFDAGAMEPATKVAREAAAEASKLGQNGFDCYARGVVAETLVRIDSAAALDLIEDLKDDREYDRHHGNIARRLVATDPAEAQRVLAMVRDDFQRDQHAQRLAWHLAPVDLAAARRVADSIKNRHYRAYAHGLLAQALAGKDQPAAEEELHRAFELLAEIASGDQTVWNYHTPPVLAAWFLSAAEAIDVDRLDEYFWRALSLRLPLAKHAKHEPCNVTSQAFLAMLLARYDRETARAIYGELAQRAQAELEPTWFASVAREIYAAAALIDSRWAVEMAEQLPDDADLAANGPKNAARISLVKVLSRRGDDRWQAAFEMLGLWSPSNADE
jgi:hypothetical protein